MKSALAIVLLAVTLSGCVDEEARLDASSEEALQASTKRISDSLPPGERERFGQALIALTFGEAVNSTSFLTAAKAAQNPNFMVTAALPLSGKTGAEIITIADTKAAERKFRQAAAIAQEIETLKKDIEAGQASAEKSRSLLNGLVITGARFRYNDTGYSRQPSIAFKIENKGTVPIKRFFARGILETPGRAVPWVDDDFNYEIPGGMEPGETQNLDLAPNQFSAWGKVPPDATKNAVLTISVVDFEGPDGNRQVGSSEEELTAKRSRLTELEKQQRMLTEDNPN